MPVGEDDAFLAAWGSRDGLFRALRDDAPVRYLSLTDAPAGGVLLVAPAAVWDDARFLGRQGFLGATAVGDVVVAHWSSPLMYQRAGSPLPGAYLYSKSPVR